MMILKTASTIGLALLLFSGCGSDEEPEPGDHGVTSENEAPAEEEEAALDIATVELSQKDLVQVVSEDVPTEYHEALSVSGSTASVIFNNGEDEEIMEGYFGTNDRVNQIIAVDAVRWFIALPEMTELNLNLPLEGHPLRAHMTRDDVEQAYGVSLDALSADESGELWKEFREKWDTEEKRVEFVRGRLH